MGASVGALLRQAVTDKMDGFLARHQDHFKNIAENGREIALDFRRFDSFEYYLTMMLSLKVEKWSFHL
jgi:predicted alpha-1,6-mannanase (GH76 family)